MLLINIDIYLLINSNNYTVDMLRRLYLYLN